jgi:peptide-methionine (S)-S-oxide reductase
MTVRIVIACLALWVTSPVVNSATVEEEEAEHAIQARAIFAGGCFWCMQPPYDKLDGVISTTAGYTGGTVKDPTYEQVSAGTTGHAEAVEVIYDPEVVSYETLLKVFWHNIDPLDGGGQFCDRGSQYRSAIFYLNNAQKEAAMASLNALQSSGQLKGPIRTQLVMASAFYPAEDYHQNYYQRNSVRYNFYRWGCGRDERLQTLWGDNAGKP